MADPEINNEVLSEGQPFETIIWDGLVGAELEESYEAAPDGQVIEFMGEEGLKLVKRGGVWHSLDENGDITPPEES